MIKQKLSLAIKAIWVFYVHTLEHGNKIFDVDSGESTPEQ